MTTWFAAAGAIAGLLLPGAGWAFAFRWPAPWLAGGVISALAIFAGWLLAAFTGIPLSRTTLGIWLGTVTLAGAACWWSRRAPTPVTGTPTMRRFFWLALPATPMFAVAAWRAVFQPLSGPDAVFRWDHLAQLTVQLGHFDFYPPHTAEGFSLYFWADGIAPLVSGLYAWTYFAVGSADTRWTAIPVLLQVAGLGGLLFHLGDWWGGSRAGWFAVAVAGATLLLQFAFGLGQETGCTALGAGGMVFYLLGWQRERTDQLLVPAAACAALVACAREYGVAFLGLGAIWLWVSAAGAKRTLAFLGGAALLPALWYGRNAVLTGNPFYAMNVAGWFPLNGVFDAWMRGYQALYGPSLYQLSGWREIVRLLLLSAVPALLGFGAGAWLWRRQAGWSLGVLVGVLTVVLWLVSVPYTAGGFFYSMRVLSPLLVLGCAWGGAALARWIPGRRHLAGLLAGLALFGGDAALRAWTIPINPYTLAPREWPEAGYRMQLEFARDDQAVLQAMARQGAGKVLSDSAGVQAIFRAEGRTLVPFWSPDVAFLFAPEFHGDAATRLRELGFSHVLLKRAQFTVDFLVKTGAAERLNQHLRAVANNDSYIFFELMAPVVTTGGTP